jgi:hypothetical protein
LDQASPTNQFIDSIMRSDQLNDKQKRRAVNAIRWYQDRGLDPFDPTLLTQVDANGQPLVPGNIRSIRGEIMRAAQTVGFGGYGDWAGLQSAQREYNQKAAGIQAQMEGIANEIRGNRFQGIANLADIAGNAGLRTDELAALYEPQIARQFQDERERILQTANAGRFNPGAALGRLGETQALTQKTSAIERALQILGGQTSITQQALAPAQSLAATTSAQRQGGTLNMANIGAAQSNAQQQLAAQQAGALGTGIASAGSQLGNLGLLLGILNQGKQTTGGPAAPANNSVMANQPGYNTGYATGLPNLLSGLLGTS